MYEWICRSIFRNPPIYAFFAASLPGTSTAHQLVVAIRQKCTPEEVLSVLSDLPNPNENDGEMEQFNPLKIDVFVQTLLNLGSKSFSHSFAAISKFHFVFKVKCLSTGPINQLTIHFFSFLEHSPHRRGTDLRAA